MRAAGGEQRGSGRHGRSGRAWGWVLLGALGLWMGAAFAPPVADAQNFNDRLTSIRIVSDRISAIEDTTNGLAAATQYTIARTLINPTVTVTATPGISSRSTWMRKGTTGAFTSGRTQTIALDPGQNTIQIQLRVGSSVRSTYTLLLNRRGDTILLSRDTLSLTEAGAAATYTVRLGMQPQANVIVDVTVPAGGAVSTGSSGLGFSATSWNTARTVTVNAPNDANAAGETVRIRHSVRAGSSSDFLNADAVFLTVNVTDNDTAAISVSQRGALRLTEGGSSTYTVRLSHQPTGSVVVEVLSGDQGAATVNGAGSQNLSFSTTTWNTAQAVTVAAVHDGDLTNETVRIGHQVDPDASPDEYDAAAAVDVTVTVTDDDGLRVVPRTTTVGEGSTVGATYTVALKSQPAGTVTVSVGVPSGNAVTAAPGALTFTGGASGNWGTGQTVTVTAAAGADDPDAADRAVTLSHAVASAGAPYNYAAQAADNVTVTIDDDETAALVLSRSAALALREGETGTYTVRLGTPPAAGNVEVRVSSAEAAKVTVNRAGGTAGAAQTLTFSAGNWNTGQAITVEAAQDADGGHESVTLTHAVVAASSADEYDDVAAETLAVEVTDDEGAEIAVSRGTGVLALAETGTTSATYTVRLSLVPTAAVTVAVTSADAGAVTVNGAGAQNLSFSTTTWNTAQTVTVAAVTDADATHERVTVRHAAAAGSAPEYVTTRAVTFAVTVTDDDAGLSVTPRAVTVEEGGAVEGPYTLALSTAPTGPVTVTVGVPSGNVVTAVPGALTFTATNWNTGQAVTVRAGTGVDDADGVDPAAAAVTHTLTSADTRYSYAERATERVTVTIEDDETPGVIVSRLRLALQEDPAAGGGSGRNVGTYTMVLGSAISGTGLSNGVAVRIRSSDLQAVTVSTALAPFSGQSNANWWRVWFLPSNWNVPQTVTVTAVGDDDGRDEVVELTQEIYAVDGNARDEGYVMGAQMIPIAVPNTTVTVIDDEEPALVVDTAPGTAGVQTGAVEVTEGSAATAAYTLALGALPTAAVTVSVASGDTSAVTVAPAALTFTTASWNTAQTVTATPTANDMDAEHERVTVTHTLTGAAEYVPPALPAADVARVTVAVTDNDAASARIYTSSPGTLDERTLNDARLGVQVTNTTWAGGVQTGAANFADYFALDTAVPGLTLAGIAAVPSTNTVALRLAYDGSDFDTAQMLTVRVLAAAHAGSDVLTTGARTVEPTRGVEANPAMVTVAEGAEATYTLRLTSQPGGAVTVSVASSDNTDVTVAPAALTFTGGAGGTWNTAQTVTVRAGNDDDGTDETATLTHTATAGSQDPGYTFAVARTRENVAVTVTDDDTAGVTVSATALALMETGPGSGTYTVVLNTQPTAPVTVAVASGEAAAVTATPGALTFSTATWETAQAVTATAVADDDAIDERVTVTHTLTGAAEYAGSAGPPVVAGVTAASVTVTVEDDEEQGLTLDPTAVTVAEDGSATYTVVLTSEPTAPVLVRIEPDRTNPDVHAQPGLLQYTASTWDTAQPVTVQADADADAQAETATLTHTAAGGDYTGLAADTLAVSVTDDDAGVVLSRRALTVVDGQTAQYTLVLAAAPAGPVTVTVTSSDTNVAIVGTTQNPASRAVVFTAGNWQTAQAVPVTGIGAGAATLSHTVSGYGMGTTAASVAVTVVGTGTGFLRIVPQALTVLEGASGTYTVRLGTDPGGPVTVTVGAASNVNSDMTRAPGALTFTGGAWGTAQTVTVTAGTDLGTTEGSATIAHTVTGYGSVASGPSVNVSEDEDETPTLGSVLAQTYRAGQPVNVRLPRATAAGNPPVTYAVTGPLPATTTLTLPAGLTFEAATRRLRGTPQMTAAAATYRLTATDADGDAATQDFTVTVEADPLPGFAAAAIFRLYPLNQEVGQEEGRLPAPQNPDNQMLTFYVTPALPAGLTYEPPMRDEVEGVPVYLSGGQIVGTPTEGRPRRGYTLTVVDPDGNEAQLPFELATQEEASPPDPGPGPEPEDRQPTFGDATVETQRYAVGTAVMLTLPAATGGDPPLGYTLTPPEFPVGLTYTPPAEADATGGTLTGTPAAVHPATTYTLTATDADGDTATLTFAVEVRAVDTAPTFGEQTVEDQTYTVGTAIPLLTLPAATGGDGGLTYTLTGPAGAAPPAGLSYTPPTVEDAHGGTLSGTPTEAQPATPYTLTATDADGDPAALTFAVTVEAVRTPVQVTLTPATAEEGRPVEFAVTLSRAVAAPLTLAWTAGRPGSATPDEDYRAVTAGQLTLAAGTTAGTLTVPTLDDRRVEPTETFTVTMTQPAETWIDLTQATVEGRIEDDDTERARKRSVGIVLAGVGRTLATDAVDVIGDRFVRQPSAAQATVGGQALELERGPQRGRWRHAAGVAYGVARALGVEVGSPLAGGDGQFGQVRGAAWSTLTRHLRDPHAPTPPLSAWDAPGAFAAPAGPSLEGAAATGWETFGHAGGSRSMGWGSPHAAGEAPSIPPPSGRGLGGGSSAGRRPVSGRPFGHAHLPGLAGYGSGLGQLGFDRAHAATPQAVQVGALQAPVQFRRVSGAEVLSQSAFELPLSRPAPLAVASATEGTPAAGPPIKPAAQAGAAAWTLWGRGTASGFDGKPKDDFSMDGNVFTGYLGVDYRLQPNVLLGLAVAHSQGDVDYETTDVTKGDVDVTLTSLLPYAHWSPRPGLGVWGLFGAGWGDLTLRDEAGKVKTDLEMLLGAVGARQEVLTWRRIDVALKADAFLTELEAGADDRLPETAGDAQRLRLMVEGRTAWAVSEESHLTPVFEIGGRWDGGKAETGVGAELGGGLAYAHTTLGLGIEARGRYLLAHQKSAFDEWGASLTLKLDPGADRRGLWLALAPVWGAEASQVEQMWGSADVIRAGAEADTQPGVSPAQVEFDVGYGMVTHEGAGLLTTYGGLSMAGPHSHGVRLGGRLALGAWVDLSVEGERTTQQGGGAEHQVALYGHLGW